MALVTVKQVNDGLRLGLIGTAPDYAEDPRTPDIELKIDQASDIVLDYLKIRTVFPTEVGATMTLYDQGGETYLPSWREFDFSSVNGASASGQEGGGVWIDVGDNTVLAIKMGAWVDAVEGQEVIFGYSWDNAPDVTELHRYTVVSTDPTFVQFQEYIPLENEALLRLFVTMDTPSAGFHANAGQVTLFQGTGTPIPWTVDTVPKRVSAATILTVRALLDDTEESASWLSGLAGVGVTPPNIANPIVALLYRLRDPALA